MSRYVLWPRKIVSACARFVRGLPPVLVQQLNVPDDIIRYTDGLALVTEGGDCADAYCELSPEQLLKFSQMFEVLVEHHENRVVCTVTDRITRDSRSFLYDEQAAVPEVSVGSSAHPHAAACLMVPHEKTNGYDWLNDMFTDARVLFARLLPTFGHSIPQEVLQNIWVVNWNFVPNGSPEIAAYVLYDGQFISKGNIGLINTVKIGGKDLTVTEKDRIRFNCVVPAGVSITVIDGDELEFASVEKQKEKEVLVGAT
ncbi:MAG TPA: hypothetical protein PLF31_02190 [Candidatus Paceibacterota bacterium]|nr:hypothetical protein [Candidatus Paceibacterota bacterium]